MNVLNNYLEFTTRCVTDVAYSRKKVLYFGWLGRQNFGDEALFYAIKDLLPGKVSIHGSETAKVLLEKFLRMHYFDSLMLGGGTFINRNDTVLQYLVSKKESIDDFVVFGTGAVNREFCEYMGDWDDRSEQWKELLSVAKHVGVRGPGSLRYMDELGISDARLIGDPVLHLGRDTIKPKEMRKRIGVNFGYSKDRLWGKSDVKFAEKLLSIVKTLAAEGWQISLFSVWPEDTDFIERSMRDNLPGESFEIFNAWEHSIEKVLGYFDEIDLFMGEKLHAGIIAACTYTPFIMLEYRPKCRDFTESIDYLEFNARTDSVGADWTLSGIETLYRDIPFYQERLFEKVAYYKGQLKSFAGDVMASW